MEDNFYYRIFDALIVDLVELLRLPFSIAYSNATTDPVFWILSLSILGFYGFALFFIIVYAYAFIEMRQRKRLEEYATAILLASAYETSATDARSDDPKRQTISVKHDIFNKGAALNIVLRHNKYR